MKRSLSDSYCADTVAELAVRIQSVRHFDILRSEFVDYFLGIGVTMMSYHHVPPLGAEDYSPHLAVAAHGFPDDWVAQYVAEEYFLVDPIPERAMKSTVPFRWSDAREFDGLTADNLNYLDNLAEAGIGDGFAIPVFGPKGRNGYVGLGFGTDNLAPDSRQLVLLQWSAQLGHQAYCDLLRRKLDPDIRLSPRELEILHWVARGKSNAVIAEILDISPHTVDTHLRRIYKKFDVADRVMAALRGMSLGMVS